jgi:hypothetical protein
MKVRERLRRRRGRILQSMNSSLLDAFPAIRR